MIKPIKIFVDSNVWFSAFYKEGNASRLIKQLMNDRYEVVISKLVLDEVVLNIKRKLPSIEDKVRDFFQQYPITIIKNPKLRDFKIYANFAQKKDLPILVSALNYKCNYFVTGNIKDFSVKKVQAHSLEIITLREALESLV